LEGTRVETRGSAGVLAGQDERSHMDIQGQPPHTSEPL
jgi:hypothetical protein